MTEKFRRRLDLFLFAGVCAFLISFTAASIQWYRINDQLIETYFFPVAKDYSFTDWQKAADGTWSAVVYMNKVRGECVYVKGQVETVLGTTPSGEIEESTISYLGDKTPGNNRPAGYQRLDQRMRIDEPSFSEGTVFHGSVIHICAPGRYTVSAFGPFTVGVDSVRSAP